MFLALVFGIVISVLDYRPSTLIVSLALRWVLAIVLVSKVLNVSSTCNTVPQVEKLFMYLCMQHLLHKVCKFCLHP